MKEDDVPAVATAHLKPLPAPQGNLESLFREHHEHIYRTAYRVTGSASDAEDALQTVFLRLVKREGEYDLQPNPKAYLLRASVNAALDIVRSRKSSSAVALDEIEPGLLLSRGPSPEAQHSDHELRLLVRQAVARLGTKTAEFFVLRYFEGYENREIAEMHGTSQMVVAVVLHRARLRLRKEIGQYLEKHHEA